MATFSSNQFFFDKQTKLFTTDMSMLDNGRTVQVFHKVYQDAIDQGFIMVSHHTGKEITFVIDKIDGGDEEHDGEIMGWNLVPTAESIRKIPACKGMRVLIINT